LFPSLHERDHSIRPSSSRRGRVLRCQNRGVPWALEFPHSAPVAIRLRCKTLVRLIDFKTRTSAPPTAPEQTFTPLVVLWGSGRPWRRPTRHPRLGKSSELGTRKTRKGFKTAKSPIGFNSNITRAKRRGKSEEARRGERSTDPGHQVTSKKHRKKEDVKALARTRRILLDSDDMSLAEDQHQPPAPAVPAAGPLLDAVTEEELMSSGHELPEGYTCPLCCLPIALPAGEHARFMSCCMKRVCLGCILASRRRGMGNNCAFCRTPTPDSDAAVLAQAQKRVDAKDPGATEFLAVSYFHGDFGLWKDIPRAIELWKDAARLGDLYAHYKLGFLYYYGEGVEQDMDGGIRHWQHAAIMGHPESRHALGLLECDEGNHDLAVQHLMISAKMGGADSLNEIKDMFMKGHATKAQYAEALKGYQTALEETKSPQREEAKKIQWNLGARDVSGQRSSDLRFHATHAGIDCETEVGIPQKRQAIGSRNSLFNFIQEHVVVYPSIKHASEINSPRRARGRGAEEYDAVVYTHISYDADLQSGATKYRDGQTSATVYSRGPPKHDRSLHRAQTHAKRATRTNPVQDPKRRISKRAATTLGTARFGRNDINNFQGRSHGSLDRKAQRLGRRSGKIPAPGRALNPAATYGAVRFQTMSLRHVGEGAKFVLVSGEVAVPIEDLKDFLSIPDHTLVFHKAPALKVLSQADAATTIQRRARGFLARAMGRRQQAAAITLQRSARGLLACAMGRRQQAAAITLQRHARGIAIRAQAGARCARHFKVQGSEPTRGSEGEGGDDAVQPVDGDWPSAECHDSPKVVRISRISRIRTYARQ
ncbi:hypothetical protein THAOC_23253, partial [Thalassiosira oceanica]